MIPEVAQLLAIAAIAVGMHRFGLSSWSKTALILSAEAISFVFVASFLYWPWCARLACTYLVKGEVGEAATAVRRSENH